MSSLTGGELFLPSAWSFSGSLKGGETRGIEMVPPRRPDIDDLLKMGGVSLALHVVLVIFLSLNPWPMIIKVQPSAYTVTLMSVPLSEPETRFKQPPLPAIKEEEKQKPVTKTKKDDIVEKVKTPPKKVEKPEEKKADLKQLHDALEEIRKKAALDEIQKKIARRERVERGPAVPSPAPVISSTKPSVNTESKLNQYYSLIWGKIKEAWTIPKNVLEERVDLETIIVLIIEKNGKVRKIWFEKKSGNDLYDQTALRAIKKADPLPPIPDELREESLEIGIRFSPD
jgi:TonB family protein